MGKKHRRHLRSVPKASPPNSNGVPANGTPPAPAQLEKRLEQVLEPLPPQQRTQVKGVLRAFVQEYSGPIPHPEHLERYNDILPGAAERIVAMAEAEQSHRHDMDVTALRWEGICGLLGLIFGFVIAAGLVAGAVACAFFGQREVGLALVGASALGIVTAFIRGREWRRAKEQTPPSGQTKK